MDKPPDVPSMPRGRVHRDGHFDMNKISIMPPCIWDRTRATAWMNGVDSVFAIYCHRCGARTPPKTTLAEAQDVWRDMMDGTRTELLAALENLIENAQPDNWDDDDNPDQAAAWRAAFRALCKAKGLPIPALSRPSRCTFG